MNSIAKAVIALVAASAAWLALRSLANRGKEAALEREAARQLEALRGHLFSR